MRVESGGGHGTRIHGVVPVAAWCQTRNMQTIREVAGQELVWVQPARMKQNFELRAGDEVVATLRWERSSLATGETSEQTWTFKREGFWHPRITLRVPGSNDNMALFNPGWTGGGTLEFPQGRTLHFGAANFWRSEWVWAETKDTPLVRFKSRQGLLKTEGQVEIDPSAAESPDLALLVVLGWYLLILFARDASAQAGATAAVVASSGA
jgi:hypothetical protein